LLMIQQMLLTRTQWKIIPQHTDSSAHTSHFIQREERLTEQKNFLEDLPPPDAEFDNPDSSFGLIDSVLGQDRHGQDMRYLGWSELGGLNRKEVWMTEGDMLVLKGGLLMDTNNLEDMEIFGRRTLNHSYNASRNKLKKIQKTSGYEDENKNEKTKYQGIILWHKNDGPIYGIRKIKTKLSSSNHSKDRNLNNFEGINQFVVGKQSNRLSHEMFGREEEGENLQLSFIKSNRIENKLNVEEHSGRIKHLSRFKTEKIILQ